MNAAKRMTWNFMLMTWVAAASFLASCSSKSTKPVEEENLLSNGSFEVDGEPTLSGWTPANSNLAEVVSQPAPGGGDYSLQLSADWFPTSGFVTSVVPELHDGDIVLLSADVRAVGSSGGGSIGVYAGHPARIVSSHSKTEITYDTSWSLLSLTDTLTLGTSDSVWVKLSSLNTEIEQRIGQFDRVSLVRLDN